ncbi:hypothetical protein [Pareuzebyella sediminis]|uniref:hypothetical protein n=1 Tax=Pareuzebyella sediminis TaxID=2607998 RepID=UPI0011EBAFE3|nr:hypothetical protein [Pareuzebyella sediminis]
MQIQTPFDLGTLWAPKMASEIPTITAEKRKDKLALNNLLSKKDIFLGASTTYPLINLMLSNYEEGMISIADMVPKL